MADEDLIPVRDNNPRPKGKAADTALDIKFAHQRGLVSKMDRNDLEDRYLRMYEENILLKKHARKQEDKIKRMATKLLRLVSDKKKTDIDGVTGVKITRNVEVEEKMADFTTKIHELEKQNAQLKEKLMLTKQQLVTTGKRPTAFPYAQARINTGIAKTTSDPRLTKNLRVMGPPEQRGFRSQSPPAVQRFSHSALDDARVENKNLESYVRQLEEQLNVCDMELEKLREENRLREEEFNEDLFKVRQQMTAEQKSSVHENIEMIRLQRDVKEKSTRLVALQDKYKAMDENLRAVKRSHDTVLLEMEHLNVQLKDEQNKVLTLHNQLKSSSSSDRKLIELQEQVLDAQRENQILKEANEKLVSSAFDLEREREWRQRENTLRVQIAQLEATMKSDLGEKGSILDKLTDERAEFEKLEVEHREMKIQYFQLKEQNDDLTEKMRFFTKESAVDFTELEEALVLVKQKKQKAIAQPEFLQKVDEEMGKDHHKQLLVLQAEYAETVHELEKTRNLLVMQHKINKDYHQEVQAASEKLEETKKEYDLKLDEYARLLDIRAARIKKLESQLRDVAYGTRQYKIQATMDEGETLDFDETVHLERGQNLFEIHVSKLSLNADAVKYLGDEEPSLFCTWEFFEFEIQSTPVIRGSRPQFDFTSQYIVKVDDFFLHYLQKESCTLELHQTFGHDYNTVAVCQLSFKDIFDKPHGRIHGNVSLTGVGGEGSGVGFGNLEYWVRLKVPMDQALRLYKERTKALGYITSNVQQTGQALQALDDRAGQRPADNVNELHIKVLRCSGLKARRENVQPSPYCVYQFFDFNDHDTVILHSSNNPEFNDHQTYPVPMTMELDQYLKNMPLKIFVFDDTDPEEASYIGLADVHLIPLAHDKPIQGVFELKRGDGTVSGTVEVQLRWQYSYLPPRGATRTPAQMAAAPQEVPEKLPTMSGEDLSSPKSRTPQAKPRMGPKFGSKGPSATSTPMEKGVYSQPSGREGEITAQSAAVAAAGPSKELFPKPRVPAPRKKSSADVLQESEVKPGVSMVNDAVTEAVSSVLPELSVTASTVQDQTSTGDAGSEEMSPVEESVETPEVSEAQLQESDIEEVAEAVVGEALAGEASSSENTIKDDSDPERTPRSNGVSKAEDTMFGDDAEESVEEEIEEEVAEDTRESLPRKPEMESDSEGVVMEPEGDLKKNLTLRQGNNVTIVVSRLSLEDDSPVMENDQIQQLFVEYKFLGLPPQELETPFSLPKPKTPHQSLAFNFSKTFPVDLERNYQRRQYLASMLLPDDPDEGRIRFTVVSEPPEDNQDAECEDVGVAFVSVREILHQHRDIREEDIKVYDISDETTVIGFLNVTVECLDALESVEKEMQVDSTYG